MAARVLDGKAVAADVRASVAEEVSAFTSEHGVAPGLATVLVGDDPASQVYVGNKIRACEEGVFPHQRSLDEGNLEEERRLAYVGVTRARARLYMTCARRRTLHGGAGWNLPSRFLREVPDELVNHHAMATRTGWQSGGRPLGGMPSGGGISAPERRQPQTPEIEFRVGDDVVHASFGEGVITAVEPGAVIVVRFASGGGDRKLMADYAPLKKRS